MFAGHCSTHIVSLATNPPVAVGGDQSFDQSHSTTWNRFLGFSRLAGVDDTNGIMSSRLCWPMSFQTEVNLLSIYVLSPTKLEVSLIGPHWSWMPWSRYCQLGVAWVGLVEGENTPVEGGTSSECIDNHPTCNDLWTQMLNAGMFGTSWGLECRWL